MACRARGIRGAFWQKARWEQLYCQSACNPGSLGCWGRQLDTVTWLWKGNLGSQVTIGVPPDAAVHPAFLSGRLDRGAGPGPEKETSRLMAGSVGGPFQEAGGPLRSLRRAWYPAPPTRDRTGACGTLPFIHKLLEVLGEDTAGQLRRRLWERTDRWESGAHAGSGIREKTLPSLGQVRTAWHLGILRAHLS